jgi:hypothetical protein
MAIHSAVKRPLAALQAVQVVVFQRAAGIGCREPPSGVSQNAWVYICPQTTKSMYQLIGMHLGGPSAEQASR